MMSLEPDHYAVLELRPGSPIEDVKSQYRRLAKLCHPDLHGNNAKCQEQFRRINAAYTFLSDAPRKAAYDACLQVARKNAAPAPKPPPRVSRSSATATGYNAPMTATEYHEWTPTDLRTPFDFRMTRSAWLGATAGLVVVLLVIGLSLDGLDRGRPLIVEGASSSAIERAPVGALGNGSEPGGDAAPTASLPDAPLSVPVDAPSGGASETRPPRLFTPPDPLRVSAAGHVPGFPPSRVSRAWVPSPVEDTNPADVLKHREHIAHIAGPAREDESDGLRDRLAADAAALNAAPRQLSLHITPKNSLQEAKASLVSLRRWEDGRRPVRDGLKALSAKAFRFTLPAPPAPARSASVMPLLPAPAPTPRAASAAPDVPKPSATEAAKPKAPTSSGQEFIMWSK